MKKKEKNSLRSMERQELVGKIQEAQSALMKLHIEKTTSQVKNTRAGRKLRLVIATSQTIMREKELIHE